MDFNRHLYFAFIGVQLAFSKTDSQINTDTLAQPYGMRMHVICDKSY